MSKKSYKQLQNRLYREIKRRMLAESRQVTANYTIERPCVKTLKIRRSVQMEEDLPGQEAFLDYVVRNVMAKQMVDQLIDDGYIKYSTRITENPRELIVECRLNVCRSKEP